MVVQVILMKYLFVSTLDLKMVAHFINFNETLNLKFFKFLYTFTVHNITYTL